MFEKAKPYHIKPQLDFFKNKQKKYKEKHWLEKEKQEVNSKHDKPELDLKNEYLEYDFRFFLSKNIEESKYTFTQIRELISSYKKTVKKLEKDLSKNSSQTLIYIENKLIKCHNGNSLVDHFGLGKNIGFEITDFNKYGEIWAYFEIWKRSIEGYNFKNNSSQKNKFLDKKTVLIKKEFNQVFELLKIFFEEQDHSKLKETLKYGINQKTPLIFNGNGNRFADAFKKLIENDFIVGKSKQELQKWIAANFKYIYRSNIKEYSNDYLEKCISRNDNPCKNSIFEITNGKISN